MFWHICNIKIETSFHNKKRLPTPGIRQCPQIILGAASLNHIKLEVELELELYIYSPASYDVSYQKIAFLSHGNQLSWYILLGLLQYICISEKRLSHEALDHLDCNKPRQPHRHDRHDPRVDAWRLLLPRCLVLQERD